MSSRLTGQVAVLTVAMLGALLKPSLVKAQGQYLHYRESGAQIQLSYATSVYQHAFGIGAGFSLWGVLDPGAEVVRYTGPYSEGYSAFAFGGTIHPIKPVVKVPVQPYASIAYQSATAKGGSAKGFSEAVGVYGQIVIAKCLTVVPDLSLSWSSVDRSNSEVWYGSGLGVGIKVSSRAMVTIDAHFAHQDYSPDVTTIGIGLIELEPPSGRR